VGNQVGLDPLVDGLEHPGGHHFVPRHLNGQPLQGALRTVLCRFPYSVQNQLREAGKARRTTSARVGQQTQQLEKRLAGLVENYKFARLVKKIRRLIHVDKKIKNSK